MVEIPKQRILLGSFLRARRERLLPEAVGLPGGGRRRTAGLRREELSTLANVGVSWYTALEQGRDVIPSVGVLHSLANVLRLTIDERVHLFALAGHQLGVKPVDVDEEIIDPSLHQILQALEPNPAYILNLPWNYVAWNATADLVFSITEPHGEHPRNLVWQLFTNPAKRHFYIHWEAVAQNVAAEFRAETEKVECSFWSCQFAEDLKEASPDFRRIWHQHKVQSTIIRRKELCHPVAGHLSFDHTPFQLAAHPSLKMIVYTPVGESVERLAWLRAEAVK